MILGWLMSVKWVHLSAWLPPAEWSRCRSETGRRGLGLLGICALAQGHFKKDECILSQGLEPTASGWRTVYLTLHNHLFWFVQTPVVLPHHCSCSRSINNKLASRDTKRLLIEGIITRTWKGPKCLIRCSSGQSLLENVMSNHYLFLPWI